MILLLKGLFPAFCGYLAALFCAHVVGVCGHNLDAPFAWLAPLDNRLIRTRQRIAALYARVAWRRPKKKNSATPHSDGDEAFVNAMLEKIARSGERSLTQEERERLGRRSKKRG